MNDEIAKMEQESGVAKQKDEKEREETAKKTQELMDKFRGKKKKLASHRLGPMGAKKEHGMAMVKVSTIHFIGKVEFPGDVTQQLSADGANAKATQMFLDEEKNVFDVKLKPGGREVSIPMHMVAWWEEGE